MRWIITLVVLFVSKSAISQKEFGMSWIQGSGLTYKISFNSSPPSKDPFNLNYQYYFDLGTSCISDSNGRLKLICNGYRLVDSSGVTINNGDSLTPKKLMVWDDGFSRFTQASIIIPFENNQYCVFISAVSDSLFEFGWLGQISVNYFDQLLMNRVNMNAFGGLGMVTEKGKKIIANKPISATQLMACRHSDGKNWWLLKQADDTNMVYKFIVTKDSIYNMGIQGFSTPNWKYNNIGQSMFSLDGLKYATSGSTNEFFIADFNRCDGELSNPKSFIAPIDSIAPGIPNPDLFCTGINFSPSGRFIYILKYYNLYQLDLLDPDSNTAWYRVANMDTAYNEFMMWAGVYNSPDGRLFLGNWGGLGKAWSTIDNPDVKGSGCNFCPKCFRFPTWGVNNPPTMPNYALGIDSSNLNCTPVGLVNQSESAERRAEWSFYPNPTCETIIIQNATGKKKVLYSALGEAILSTLKNELDVSRLPKGVYYLYCDNKAKKVVVD